MSQATALVEGARATYPVGRVTVALTCIREGAAYRTAAHLGATAGLLGAEVDCLSASYPWHIGAKHQTARVQIGTTAIINSRPVPETEPVWVRAEAYDSPDGVDGEEPGVYVSALGQLSVDDAIRLACDLMRSATEITAGGAR